MTELFQLVVATHKETNQILFHQRADNTSYNFPVELFHHDEVRLLFLKRY